MTTILSKKENFVIKNIRPSVENGAYCIKREPGDMVLVQADLFRHSHEKYQAAILYKHSKQKDWKKMVLILF